MSAFELRPHHSLCIGFFRGRGYSEDFVANMARIAAMLHAQDPLLTLCSAADGICRPCPHNAGGVCDSGGKAARYDAAVLRLTGLPEGTRLRWSELRERTERSILSPGRLGEVCGGCEWFAICGGGGETDNND